jgi:hypothetical protein
MAATTQVVNAVIVVECAEEGHALPVQRPVYYISEVLPETKARYPQVQKRFTQWFSRDANSATTSRLTWSRWFPPFR